MAQVCEICGKGSNNANRIRRRGKAKKEGGVGRNVTSVSKRSQKPNLQKIKAMVDGNKKRIKVCTTCIKSDRVTKAY
ncbi:50S ribosomal protein L28 [Halanaerobiaceae bacterium Z-7014]|uniref:Large ribosomal subunit protein bL28 n=1 Tax=Halonatronomonas betaini TaxID=2778430 RepID=A0A931FAB7_9FIRM|nr:50S ribosomal protein L28 [Halonatronomonas betaini]MBF8436797.1 50S ribosomal protein L28 [Halonatronomonas betaini]